ncbi:hypothetical protein BST81_15575 [Leptolyngbya sp. 'hensonii']|uniref:hypothetical protein n=1 Tax=Leptolyngbya sp. 'hensonii' TaxID=1922337 RepID=UPI0009502F26|nr:hypothetical protein [Leptolyngbya sp. 'hensonii']OLP17737.1 hypothetical protein BST81_15575 [Leptolyngbya sp. 'hensonii']
MRLFPSSARQRGRFVYLGLILGLACSLNPPIEVARAIEPPDAASLAIQRLQKMFSPAIQSVLKACQEEGKVDLAAGADQDGSVICGNGSRNSTVLFSEFVTTYSDIVAASGLIGLQTLLKDNPRLKPETIITLLNTPNGKTALRSQLRKVITQSELVAKSSPQSVNLLTDKVIQRVEPSLKSPSTFKQVLGTSDQYRRVVENFCTPPGMPVKQAQTMVPGLSSVQLYAICVQESGLAEEIRRRSKT